MAKIVNIANMGKVSLVVVIVFNFFEDGKHLHTHLETYSPFPYSTVSPIYASGSTVVPIIANEFLPIPTGSNVNFTMDWVNGELNITV